MTFEAKRPRELRATRLEAEATRLRLNSGVGDGVKRVWALPSSPQPRGLEPARIGRGFSIKAWEEVHGRRFV